MQSYTIGREMPLQLAIPNDGADIDQSKGAGSTQVFNKNLSTFHIRLLCVEYNALKVFKAFTKHKISPSISGIPANSLPLLIYY